MIHRRHTALASRDPCAVDSRKFTVCSTTAPEKHACPLDKCQAISACQLLATDRTKKLVRVSPAETSHYERRRRNAADHVSRSSLGARLVQADAGAGQGFRHLQCGSRKALAAAGDNRPARAGGDFRAQIHLTLVIRRASANRNLNGRFWESREAAAGRLRPVRV